MNLTGLFDLSFVDRRDSVALEFQGRSLTFGEIEDIVGFSLPECARLQPEWWVGADLLAPRSAQSDSWTMASRTAVANLSAQHVVFDRTP